MLVDKKRTTQQNRALHLWFTQLAEELNNHGLDITKTLSRKIQHPWTPVLIKELIFRPVMKSYIRKQSTKELKTDEIDKVFDVINRWLGENYGIGVMFPSIENLIEQEKN